MPEEYFGDVFSHDPGHPFPVIDEQGVTRAQVDGSASVVLDQAAFAGQNGHQFIPLLCALERSLGAAPDPISGCVSRTASINAAIGLWRAFGDHIVTFRGVERPEFERTDVVPEFVL